MNSSSKFQTYFFKKKKKKHCYKRLNVDNLMIPKNWYCLVEYDTNKQIRFTTGKGTAFIYGDRVILNRPYPYYVEHAE